MQIIHSWPRQERHRRSLHVRDPLSARLVLRVVHDPRIVDPPGAVCAHKEDDGAECDLDEVQALAQAFLK